MPGSVHSRAHDTRNRNANAPRDRALSRPTCRGTSGHSPSLPHPGSEKWGWLGPRGSLGPQPSLRPPLTLVSPRPWLQHPGWLAGVPWPAPCTLFILRSLRADPREAAGSAPAGVAGGLWTNPGLVPGPAAELGKGRGLYSGQRKQPEEAWQRRGGQEEIWRGGGRLGALEHRGLEAWGSNWSPELRPGKGGGGIRWGETGGWSKFMQKMKLNRKWN